MDLESLQRAQLLSCWLALAGLAAYGGFRLVANRRSLPRPDPAGSLAAFALALVFRLAFSPWAVIHENAHGYEFLRSAFSLDGFFYHGAAFYAVQHPFARLLGERPETVFGVNLLLSAACAPLLLGLARRLRLPRAAGWTAAVAWSAWPAAVRSAGSECFFPLAVLSLLLALQTWLDAWERRGRFDFVAAGLAAALAVQARPELVLLPASLALAWLARPGWTRALRTVGPYLGLLAFAALAAAWAVFRLRLLSEEGLPSPVRLGLARAGAALFSPGHILVNPAWSPPAVATLALLGLAALALARWRLAVFLAGSYLLLLLPVVGVGSGLASDLRLQQSAAPFALLLAGAGLAWIADRMGTRWRFAGRALLLAAVAAGTLLLAGKAGTEFAPQLEYRFLADETPKLPPDCRLVVADRFMAGGKVSAEFPTFWLKRPEVTEAGRLVERGLDVEECLLYYRGLACASFLSGEDIPPGGVRPECRAIERRFRLEPLRLARLPGLSDADFLRLPAEVTIGFYRLGPRPPEPPLTKTGSAE